MDENHELEELRLKLWGHYVSIRSTQKINTPFHEFWYEFLARHFASERSTFENIEEFCNQFNEKK